MSCYHPIAAWPDYDAGLSETGNYRYKLSGSYHPEFKTEIDPNVIKIPCGKCLGCRLDQARSWADRMVLEYLSCGKKAVFVTLTYNNEHVPIGCDDLGECSGYSLCKRDLQLFFKRLRKYFSTLSIRYYACGEYGGCTRRPHYHAIIFGLGLADFAPLSVKGYNELGQTYYVSDLLTQKWENGFTLLSDVSYKTMSYVARYCMKKATDFIPLDGCEPEFHTMSRSPGLGAFYYKQHSDLFESDHIYFADQSGSKSISIPKYFWNKLEVDNPEDYVKFKVDRSKMMNDKELIKLSNTSLSYLDMLELEEESLINKTKILFKRREEVNFDA